MSQPLKLYRLQQIDSHIDQARARTEQIEMILLDDVILKQAESTAADVEARLHEVQRSLKRSEEEVQAQRIKIEQTESTLYGGKVRNPKELQDLQNESAALKRYLGVLEDRQLENMMALEEIEEVFRQAHEVLVAARSQAATRNSMLTAEQKNLLKDLARMENERTTITDTIEPDDLGLYEQLRQQRRGVAVSKVTDRACASCGSTLTPSTIQAAQSPSQLTRCTFCGRILYAG